MGCSTADCRTCAVTFLAVDAQCQKGPRDAQGPCARSSKVHRTCQRCAGRFGFAYRLSRASIRVVRGGLREPRIEPLCRTRRIPWSLFLGYSWPNLSMRSSSRLPPNGDEGERGDGEHGAERGGGEPRGRQFSAPEKGDAPAEEHDGEGECDEDGAHHDAPHAWQQSVGKCQRSHVGQSMRAGACAPS